MRILSRGFRKILPTGTHLEKGTKSHSLMFGSRDSPEWFWVWELGLRSRSLGSRSLGFRSLGDFSGGAMEAKVMTSIMFRYS